MGLPDYNTIYIKSRCFTSKPSTILSQEQKGVERVTYYGARNLRANDMNWHSYELEASAVAFACTTSIAFYN